MKKETLKKISIGFLSLAVVILIAQIFTPEMLNLFSASKTHDYTSGCELSQERIQECKESRITDCLSSPTLCSTLQELLRGIAILMFILAVLSGIAYFLKKEDVKSEKKKTKSPSQ